MNYWYQFRKWLHWEFGWHKLEVWGQERIGENYIKCTYCDLHFHWCGCLSKKKFK